MSLEIPSFVYLENKFSIGSLGIIKTTGALYQDLFHFAIPLFLTTQILDFSLKKVYNRGTIRNGRNVRSLTKK